MTPTAPNPLARAGGFKRDLDMQGIRKGRTRSQERVDLSNKTDIKAVNALRTRSQERVDLSRGMTRKTTNGREPARKSGWI